MKKIIILSMMLCAAAAAVAQVSPTMVSISAGAFNMGDAKSDGLADEKPVHAVTVAAFSVGNFPVTCLQWKTVRDWAVSNGYTDLPDLGTGKGDGYPVVGVSWYDAAKWCNARSEWFNYQNGNSAITPAYYTSSAQTTVYRTGIVELASDMVKWESNGFRLPTEAEWEKAARGGLAGKRFPLGDTISHDDANYVSGPAAYDTTGSARTRLQQWTHADYSPAYDSGATVEPTTPARPYTNPIDSFDPNGYGLYDMAGNIWELCWDYYSATYYTAASVTDPRGPASAENNYRVLRGGSWDSLAFYARVSNRAMDDPRRRLHGFRVVRTIP